MLIVGLGNPGKSYANTRHNVGFMFVDRFAEENDLFFKLENKFSCYLSSFMRNGETHYLVKPMTYMNNSGISVSAVANYYKIPTEEILLVYDDRDLDIAQMRIRKKGTSGGHRGVSSVIDQIGTSEIARIRIGIGRNGQDAKDYVLSPFGKEEKKLLSEVFDKATNIINDYLDYGIDYIMNNYNNR